MAVPENLIPAFNRDKVPTPGDGDTQTFTARCHCQSVQFSVTIPKSILPLNAYICCCGICRLTHGSFGSFHVTLPLGFGPEWTNGKINYSVYKTPGGTGQRFFCSTCGAHSGHYEPWINQWVLPASLFDQKFWEFNHYAFPKAARDGGILSWLPEVAGKELTQVTFEHDQPPEYTLETGADGEERLRAECHCGGVSFTIPRPSKAILEDEYMKMYVSPKDPKKWKAFLDFCRDCRVLSGAHFIPWIMVPRVVLEPEMPADLRLGTMKTYASSGWNTRGFCGVCGATVALRNKSRMPTDQQMVLNIAMGILRAPEGVRAENWVTWRTGAPAFAGPEDTATKFDPEFVKAAVEGHRKWGVDTHGEAIDFPVI